MLQFETLLTIESVIGMVASMQLQGAVSIGSLSKYSVLNF